MRRAVALALVLAGCCSCGLPVSSNPQRVDPSQVPFGLLDRTPPPTRLPDRGPATSVYFVRADHLRAVSRHVIGENVPTQALRLLLDGPTPAEAQQGATSDIPAGTRLISLDLNGRVATVDLSTGFGSVGGSDQVLAVAQIVFTVTASPYIDAVAFSINGQRIEVPDGSGSLAITPRQRRDYRAQAPSG